MDIKDSSVLESLNIFIITDRLNKNQILQLVNLLPVSKSFKDLRDNLKWETLKNKD